MIAAQAEATLSEMRRLARLGDHYAQTWLCHPGNNPQAAAFFIFNFCLTQDEEQQGAILPLPPPYHSLDVPKTPWHGPGEPTWGLKWVEALDAPRLDPHNVHDEKARRMLHTWFACDYVLWDLMWDMGASWLLLSKSKDHVDDSGRNTKVFSLFSRLRFTYDRLPEHVRKIIDFTYMSAVCAENDAWAIGRAPTKDAGRAGGFRRALVDECPFIEFMALIHQALDPACKFGKVYMGSVNGPDNTYAEIKKARYDGWKFFECDWKEDPTKTVGIRETVPGPERERYGSHVSPKFVSITASLRDEVIAQEYGRNYDKSTGGMILREFNREIHVRKSSDPRGPLLYDPTLEIRVGLDPGHTRKCAATVIQPVGMEKCRVIGAWQGLHRNSGENAAELVKFLRSIGYHGDLAEVIMVPDPSAFNEELGSGLETYSWYRAAGFEQSVLPLILGPNSVYLGNNVLRAMFQRNMIEMNEDTCGPLIDSAPAYKLPVDPRTNEIRSNVPVHNMSTHPWDSCRYVVTSIWTADDLPYEGFFTEKRVREVVERLRQRPHERAMDGQRLNNGYDDDDVFATIASPRARDVF